MKTTAFSPALFSLLLIACAPQVETTEVSAELPPAPAPEVSAGDVFVHLNKVSGEQETSRVLAIDGDVVHMINETTGCSFKFQDGAYGPALEWSNCGGDSGTQVVEGEKAIFPLEVGSRETWEVSGSNSRGDTWQTVRNCEVVGTANVTVPAGAFDTYHVRCEDTWRIREYFYSPDVRLSVLSRERHKRRGDFQHRELVSYTPAA